MKLINKFFNFKRKVVLITGCNGQIGSSLVKFFLDSKSKVYGLDLNKEKKCKFNFIQTDISNEKQIKDSLDKIFKKEKKIDIVINNAGTAVFTNYKRRTEDEINNVFKTNVAGVINIIKNYSILFDKNKLKRGKIINIASIYGFISPDFNIYSKGDRFSSEIYGATKSSIIQLTKYYSVLLAKKNINVNCISPGGILNKKVQSSKFINKYKQRVPKKRMGNTEDLITSIIYLSSDYSDYTTGQNIVVDGGLSSI